MSKKSTNKKNTKKAQPAKEKEQLRNKRKTLLYEDIFALVTIGLGALLIFAIFFQQAGEVGNAVSWFLKGSFGILAYSLPFYLILYGILLLSKKTVLHGWRTIILLLIIFVSLSIINSARFIEIPSIFSFSKYFADGVTLKNGGLVGMVLSYGIIKAIGQAGVYIVSIIVIIISILFLVNSPLSSILDNISKKRKEKKSEKLIEEEGVDYKKEDKSKETSMDKKNIRAKDNTLNNPSFIPFSKDSSSNRSTPNKPQKNGQVKIIDYMKDDSLFEPTSPQKGYGLDGSLQTGEMVDAGSGETKISNKDVENITLNNDELNQTKLVGRYKFPPIDLLEMSKPPLLVKEENLKENADKLERTLEEFKVKAKVSQVTKGPAVTRYEIQPDTGVKVKSIVSLADDIALNLRAKSIRIEAPIPGKAAVGIEVGNENVNLVTLRDIIGSKEFKKAESKISFALGKDISGKSIVGDLKSMPHLLIAGATGSGKSVCINSIIMSILYKSTPDEVKLVLIDPKVVELRNYIGIPHLLVPVVTDPTKAAASLNWAVAEMNDRYHKFADVGVKELESYNDLMRIEGKKEEVLPQIVIIIDELADLMMVSPSKVEEAICRLAQMARAAGMHLIVATQRPSVDIITGVIKANIPSRIAFAVSSQFDSRTILDMGGAEHLVGKGDMLYNPVGIPKPIRVQGTFVSDKEVNSVIDFIKKQSPQAGYSEEVMEEIENNESMNAKGNSSKTKENEEDELYEDAVMTVINSKQASTSMLQRRFRIGYNRAARLMDELEANGIIGPPDGSRPREVLISEEDLENKDE